MKSNILLANYLFIEEHFCSISRIELLKSLSKLDYNTYLYFQTLSDKSLKVDEIEEVFIKRISSKRYFKYISYVLLTMITLPSIIIKRKVNFLIIDPYTILPLIPILLIKNFFFRKLCIILDFRSGIFHAKTSGPKNALRDIYLKIILRVSNTMIDKYTFVSEGLKSHVKTAYNLSMPNTLVWSSAVSEIFVDYPISEKINNGTIKLLYHGTLSSDRGIMELCEASKQFPNIHLKIIGSGPLQPKINNFLESNNINNITLRGGIPQNQIVKEINDADAGVVVLSDTLPMRTSSPLKLMEYVSLNKPVIATQLQSFKRAFSNLNGILYINDNSSEEIIKGIDELLTDFSKYKRLAQSGRKFIKSKFTWEAQATKVDKFISYNS